MTWLLEFIFGPAVQENRNYDVIQDIASLVPWWYPHFVAGCMALFLILLWAGHRRKTARMIPATAMRSKHRGTRPHPHLSIGSKVLRQTARADQAERMEARAKAIRARSE